MTDKLLKMITISAISLSALLFLFVGLRTYKTMKEQETFSKVTQQKSVRITLKDNTNYLFTLKDGYNFIADKEDASIYIVSSKDKLGDTLASISVCEKDYITQTSVIIKANASHIESSDFLGNKVSRYEYAEDTTIQGIWGVDPYTGYGVLIESYYGIPEDYIESLNFSMEESIQMKQKQQTGSIIDEQSSTTNQTENNIWTLHLQNGDVTWTLQEGYQIIFYENTKTYHIKDMMNNTCLTIYPFSMDDLDDMLTNFQEDKRTLVSFPAGDFLAIKGENTSYLGVYPQLDTFLLIDVPQSSIIGLELITQADMQSDLTTIQDHEMVVLPEKIQKQEIPEDEWIITEENEERIVYQKGPYILSIYQIDYGFARAIELKQTSIGVIVTPEYYIRGEQFASYPVSESFKTYITNIEGKDINITKQKKDGTITESEMEDILTYIREIMLEQ